MDLNLLIESINSDSSIKLKENFNILRLEFEKRMGLHFISNTVDISQDNYIVKPKEIYKLEDGIHSTPFEINKHGKLVRI